jgi:membrane associated rhomboid family serine protease
MYGNTIWDDIKWRYKFGSPFLKLIFILIATFVIVEIIGFIDFLIGTNMEVFIIEHLSLHTNLHFLSWHPWSIITYAFLHDGFFHILFNLSVLYLFGNILEDLIGKPKIIPVFLYGIIIGGLLYVLSYNIFPGLKQVAPFAINVGCSAGVMAMMIAATTLSPDYQVGLFLIGPVRLRWVAIVCIFLDFVNMRKGNVGGHIAHLGGAIFGFIYIIQLRNGTDLARPFYFIQDFFTNFFTQKKNLKVTHKNENKQTVNQTKQSSQKENINQQTKQEKLDSILDKINKSSYESLSPEEKSFLFKVSQDD